MKFLSIISLALSGLVFSCSTPATFIIPTNFEKILASANENGVTAEEADSLSLQVGNLLVSNTEGKKLPEIMVTDLENRKVKLQDMLTSKAIILSSDIHCAMAYECLLNEYPKKIKFLQQNYQLAPTICLVIKTEYDMEDELEFNAVVARLKPNYQKLYIINEAEARKMNLHYATTRLYLNEDKVVENMVIGNCTSEKLDKEIRQFNL